MEKKITQHNHDEYITNQELNKLTLENFTARSALANLPSKNDINNFVRKTDFGDKLKNLNQKVTENKTRHTVVETKLNGLEKKVKIMSTKGLTADLLNKYSILNGAKYFWSDRLQN